MKKITLILTATLCLSLFGISQSTGKLELKKGQKLEIKTSITTAVSQEAQGQTVDINADMNSITKVDIKDTNSDSLSLTNTISHLDVDASFPGQAIKFDSDKKEDLDGMLGKELGGLINKPVDMAISPMGKLLLNKQEKEAESQLIGSMGGGDPKSMFEDAFLVIPLDAKEGISWIDSSESGGKKRSTTYTIREIKGNNAIVDIKGTMNSVTNSQMMGMEVKTTLSGTVTGEAVVDAATGVVKSRTSTAESKGVSEVMSMELPLTSKITTKTTVTLQ